MLRIPAAIVAYSGHAIESKYQTKDSDLLEFVLFHGMDIGVKKQLPNPHNKGSDRIGVNACEICEVTKECYQHLNAGGKEPDKKLCACEYDYPDQYREALKHDR